MAYKRPRAASPSTAQKRARAGGAKNITLGTELPPEDDGDNGSFVPIWKQTVTDERGRRRLHGAFTGGFSAGYFNTVGSKEGWTPKTFVSSRSNRHKDRTNASSQRPEDFMDEEDLAEAAESRQLETAQGFAGIGTAKDGRNDGFFGLFMTEEETMGVKIAQKMGWRRDQGVGRKVRRLAYSEDEAMPPTSVSAHMFAPKDARAMPSASQDPSRKGVGYTSEARLGRVGDNEETPPSLPFSFLEESKTSQKPKKPLPKKSSFGVGVLNDTGSDDDDPYEIGPKIKFNKALGKEKKARKPSKFAKSAVGGHVFVPKKGLTKSTPPTSKISTRKAPLEGFALAAHPIDLPSKRRFLPPKAPPDWISSKLATSTSEMRDFQSVADAKSSTLDAKSRGALLRESPLPTRSVFDFISQDARDRIAALTGKANLPQGLGQSTPGGGTAAHAPQPKDLWSFIPILDKDIAAAALAKGATGWMPYAEDPNKRARYVCFLELRSGLRSDLPNRPNAMSISDWAKELQEFAHAAQVFKPTTGIMASRFTSSTSTQSSLGSGTANDSLLQQPATKPEDPTEQAAKLGMYGPMTRSSFPFHPSRLLCKRFNVKSHPDHAYSSEFDGKDFCSKTRTEEAVSKTAMDRMMHEVLTHGSALQRPASMMSAQKSMPTATPSQPTNVDVKSNEALTQERVSEDVFKAIFGNEGDE